MRIGQYHNLCIISHRERTVNIGNRRKRRSKERMSERERDKKEDEGGVEKRMKKMKAFLKSEYEKKCTYDTGETYLHWRL